MDVGVNAVATSSTAMVETSASERSVAAGEALLLFDVVTGAVDRDCAVDVDVDVDVDAGF